MRSYLLFILWRLEWEFDDSTAFKEDNECSALTGEYLPFFELGIIDIGTEILNGCPCRGRAYNFQNTLKLDTKSLLK
jgi:hypothetical protein